MRRNRGLIPGFAYGMMLLWAVVQWGVLLTSQLPLLGLHESIGNGDAYIFDSVEQFDKTGVLYPAVSPSHLAPALYSPFLYWMLWVAWRLMPVENHYVGPRLLELGWYLAAVAGAALLARRMVPARGSWKLGALMAGSFVVATPWVMQLRGDFPGIACSLLALYFLMSSKPSDVWWAGLLAGLALQFKITFVAAGAAGGLFLLVFRRWDQLWRFAVAAGLSSVGMYAVLAWREPAMLSNILMLRKMIQHPPGVVEFIRQVLREPVFLLALATGGVLLVSMPRQRRPRWFLLGLYLGLGFVVAVYTSLQAGANINYFYELLLGSTPLVVLGMLHLQAERWGTAAVLVGLVMVVDLGLPWHIKSAVRDALQVRGQIAQRNHDYEAWRTVLNGTKLLSTIPDVTVLRSERVMTDSLLLNYLQITAGVDLSSLEGRIRENEFDIVVTQPRDFSWRGVHILPRGVQRALLESYLPYCFLEGDLAHLPSHPKDDRASDNLRERLRKAGCNVRAVEDCLKDGKCGLQVADVYAIHE